MKKKKPIYKKKFKGVRYIAKALVKYQKSEYKSYKQALPKAREINSLLQLLGKRVKLENIWEFSRVKRIPKSKVPSLPGVLQEPKYYFELADYPAYIVRCTNKIWFTSKLWSSELEPVQGGSVADYTEYFSPYVNYINSIKGQTSSAERRYETEWLVVCTPPIFNVSKKRWESKLISIDGTGEPFDYGFDPKNPDLTSQSIVLSSKQPKPKPSTVVEPTATPQPQASAPSVSSEADRVKEIRGLISDLRQDARDGLIDKATYAELVKDLTSKLAKGGNI